MVPGGIGSSRHPDRRTAHLLEMQPLTEDLQKTRGCKPERVLSMPSAESPLLLLPQVRAWLGARVVKSPQFHRMEVKGHLITSMGLGAPGEYERLLAVSSRTLSVWTSLEWPLCYSPPPFLTSEEKENKSVFFLKVAS